MKSLTFISALILAVALSSCGGSETDASGSSTTQAPSGPELKIMALGDSITAADRVPGGYRTKLSELLTAQGDRSVFVGSQSDVNASQGAQAHEGHNGFWIENLAEETDTWVPPANPQVILLMAGTNDILNNEGANAPARLQTLIDKLLVEAPGSSVVVSSVPVLVGFEEQVNDYNAAISTLVGTFASSGKPVTFVDGGSAFTPSDLGDDNVHPDTQASYDAMAAKWATAIQPIFDAAKASQG